ncbi:hypothetical protein SCLCIDRAFT_1208033 [Scleroderma citrinum Foug A]|uniref:Uncharacterized protein n=1 Tax=Scleroderma citrinum Foug A TaxID=1036808 RepID=A0A0C3EP14_9AGAM|nr:hypothetical protein SCLCIDRAFT_1208033 [Scleroderma citrinum Foug A]
MSSRMTSARRSESQGPASTSNLPPDVITALTTLHDFVTASMQLPPQVIVTCRNEKRAFGRSALQAMSYRKAVDLFVQRFSTKNDWWISEYRYKPDVSIYARFYRRHGDEDEGMVMLDEKGWSELVGNAVRLTIVFTSLKLTAQSSGL